MLQVTKRDEGKLIWRDEGGMLRGNNAAHRVEFADTALFASSAAMAQAEASKTAPTEQERYYDMLRYIDREVTRKTYHLMTTGVNYVTTLNGAHRTLVVTMPPTAEVWWTRLDSLVKRAEGYAGFWSTIINPSAAQRAELSLDTIETVAD